MDFGTEIVFPPTELRHGMDYWGLPPGTPLNRQLEEFDFNCTKNLLFKKHCEKVSLLGLRFLIMSARYFTRRSIKKSKRASRKTQTSLTNTPFSNNLFPSSTDQDFLSPKILTAFKFGRS